MSAMGSGSGPPPGIALIDKLANHFEPTERERQRRAAMKFIAENPDHPLVVEYRLAKEKIEKGKDGSTT